MAPPCALPHLHLKNIFALLQTIRVYFFVIAFFFLLLFFGFLENYSAHPRGAVEVTVTDGKREACCHREKVREREKKRAVRMKRGKKTQLCGECVAAVQQQQQKLQGSSLFFAICVVLHFSYFSAAPGAFFVQMCVTERGRNTPQCGARGCVGCGVAKPTTAYSQQQGQTMGGGDCTM